MKFEVKESLFQQVARRMGRGGMHFDLSLVKNIAIQAVCIGVLSSWPAFGQTMENPRAIDKALHNLPDLPGAEQGAPGHFSLDQESAIVGYDSRFRKWGAKLDEYSYLSPSLTLDYGMLLTSKIGAGATITRHTGYSDILVNGVYAPKKNVRMRFASGQLRASGDYVSAFGGQPHAILQNSYLIDVKKNAGTGKLLSDFGLTAYTVRANGEDQRADYTDLSALEDDMLNAGEVDSTALATGRLDAYMLNLGLQPTPYSRIELRRERSRLTYRFANGGRGDDYRDVNHIKFSQHFNNCARFQGRYSAGADFDRLDLSLAKQRWSVNLTRAVDSSVRDASIQLGYAIPLGRSRGGSADCDARLATARAFGPLVDATVARPNQLPREPLLEAIPY